MVLLLSGCTAPNRAKETLEKGGYSNITIGDYDWFSCGKDDYFSNEFEAVNYLGQKVQGTVCCGILKGCTIRF